MVEAGRCSARPREAWSWRLPCLKGICLVIGAYLNTASRTRHKPARPGTRASMTTATLEAATHAPMHPALRWTPLTERVQHRRDPAADRTACGIDGPLVPAEPTDARCDRGCFQGP